VYDIANGLNSTGAWSEDGSAFVLQLECPGGRVPPGTPTAAVANNYSGTQPTPYLIGNNTVTLHPLGFAALPDYPRPTFMPYEIPVAHLELGVTIVRLRADVRNSRGNLRQPMLDGSFGSLDQPFIISYVASNVDNADAVYGATDLLTIKFNKPTDRAGGERYGLKNYVDGLFSFSEGDPADDYSGEWVDESTFVVQIIDPTDIIPSVSGLVPRSTRPSNLNVRAAGGRGLPGALIQNRGLSNESIADRTVLVAVEGDFGVVRTPQLLSFTADDPDNADAVLSTGDTLMLRFDVATDRGGASRAFYQIGREHV
jgi:hypothetical protein